MKREWNKKNKMVIYQVFPRWFKICDHLCNEW